MVHNVGVEGYLQELRSLNRRTVCNIQVSAE
jgi:hypothetical protein